MRFGFCPSAPIMTADYFRHISYSSFLFKFVQTLEIYPIYRIIDLRHLGISLMFVLLWVYCVFSDGQ